jgi:hypothetical protein
MTPVESLGKKEIIDLLNKCWMTHDGMWFYHCVQEFGIEKANRLNKAAIRSLAPIEVGRIRKALGMDKGPIETCAGLRELLAGAFELAAPDFMGATMSFPRENVLHWEFAPGNCFAYKGMKRMGVIDRYECGVMYRVACWIDSLGIRYDVQPDIGPCLMLAIGTCSGDFTLHIP